MRTIIIPKNPPILLHLFTLSIVTILLFVALVCYSIGVDEDHHSPTLKRT